MTKEELDKLPFDEFFKIYLSVHQHPLNKLVHVFGQVLTLSYIALVLWLTFNIHWLFIGYLWNTTEIIYCVVWPAHKYIERNQPLGKVTKWRSKAADLLMAWKLLTFQLKWDTRNE